MAVKWKMIKDGDSYVKQAIANGYKVCIHPCGKPEDKRLRWYVYSTTKIKDRYVADGVSDLRITSLKNELEEKYLKNKNVEDYEPDLFDEADNDSEIQETVVTKTYKRKEKIPTKDTIKRKELSCALWFIDKMENLDRAQKVFDAAMAASRSLEESKDKKG